MWKHNGNIVDYVIQNSTINVPTPPRSFTLELVVFKHFAGEFLHEEPCSRLDV